MEKIERDKESAGFGLAVVGVGIVACVYLYMMTVTLAV